jgi:hypothetical protein
MYTKKNFRKQKQKFQKDIYFNLITIIGYNKTEKLLNRLTVKGAIMQTFVDLNWILPERLTEITITLYVL